jgi:hypothetical protein
VLTGIIGAWRAGTGLDDLVVVDALEVDRDAEVAVAELALDHDQRHVLVRHLDRVCVAELVWREAASYTGRCCGPAKLRTRGLAGPHPSARATADDAEQRADGELQPYSEPWLELLPGPLVHADLAAPAALAAADEQ